MHSRNLQDRPPPPPPRPERPSPTSSNPNGHSTSYSLSSANNHRNGHQNLYGNGSPNSHRRGTHSEHQRQFSSSTGRGVASHREKVITLLPEIEDRNSSYSYGGPSYDQQPEYSAGHDSASMYAPMQTQYNEGSLNYQHDNSHYASQYDQANLLQASTTKMEEGDQNGYSTFDNRTYSHDRSDRPVSSSASNIIALYASSDTNENSYGTLSSAADSYLHQDDSSPGSAYGNESVEPILQSPIGMPQSPSTPNGEHSITRRPLPRIPQNRSTSNQSNPPLELRSKPPLPQAPYSTSHRIAEEDGSPFQSFSSNQGEINAFATPTIGQYTSPTSKGRSLPYSPTSNSPTVLRQQNLPLRNGTPTIQEPTQPTTMSPEPISLNALPPQYDEISQPSLNRSKSIVGKTMIGPGLGAGGHLPHLTLPDSHTQRIRNVSVETFQGLGTGRRQNQQSEWEASFNDLLSPGYVQDEASSPLHEGIPEYSLLSNVALLLRDALPRGTQVKGSVSYPYSFTGKDVVDTVQAIIPKEKMVWAAQGLLSNTNMSLNERQIALSIAKSFKKQLFFHEVDWGMTELEDGMEEVYMFLEDSMGDQGSFANDFDVELSRASVGGNKLQKGQITRANDLVDLPTGIFTPLTSCYSPLCGRPNAPPDASCYSSSCPRSQQSKNRVSVVDDNIAVPATKSSAGATHNAVAWSDTVSAELLASLSKDEIKRQNAILELIQKEEEFLNDLELLENLFLERLMKSPAVSDIQSPLSNEEERLEFIQVVFSNHLELTDQIRHLVERLHIRQREDGSVVRNIGDIYLNAALEWGSVFETNMTSFPMAKHRLQREASRNPQFSTFLEDCRRDPACHRLPMDHFLQRATTRLPRYNLHFKSIIKDTEEGNADRQSLSQAVELVDEQCKSIQKGVAAAETKVKIREYAYNLSAKRNKMVIHMDLLNPERQLVHQGRVYRKPDFTDFEWQDLLAVLFDNYLVITKTKKREEGERLVSRFFLEKRPIAVEMIQMTGFSDPPVSRSLGLSNFHLRSDRENRDLYPLTISHLTGKIEPLTLFTANKAEREEWKAKINEAIGLRTAVQEANKLFEIWPISSDLFAIPPASSLDPEKAPAGTNSNEFHGMITCAVPFRTRDGRRLIAIGCADGVWIGLRNDSKSLRKVLHLKLVMQCAVLEAFGIFVVLADKVLISYSLDALVPSANSPNNPRPPQKLSGNRDVMFFALGQVKERTLLVYMKKKPNESVFRALEPVPLGAKGEHQKSGSGTGHGLFGKFGKDSKSSDWFREYKTFFIPSEAYSMQFLRSKLCIVCARGFEIIDLDNLFPGTIPDFSLSNREDSRILALNRRVETVKPLGMFKNSEGEFILCYNEFACFVDRRGSPIKMDQIIEWEGEPHSVAFKDPFILAFDSRFIEVRDSLSGQFVQLIKTNELRNVTFSSSTMSDEEEAIILVQRLRNNQRRTHDYQQAFELIGTPSYQHHSRSTTQQNVIVPGTIQNQNGSFSSQTIVNSPESTIYYGGSNSTVSPTLHRQPTSATTATTWTSNSNGSSSHGGGGSASRSDSRRWI